MKIFRFLLVIFISLFFGTNSNNHSSVHLHKISNPQNDTSCLSFEKSKDEFIENNGYNANIVASNIKEIAAISFDVIYDKTVVSVSNINNYLQSDATSMYDDKIDNDNGAIHVSYIFSDNKNIVDEIIFGFDFKILNSEKENSYFSLSIVSAIDENGDAQTLKGDFYYFNIREEIQQNYVEIYSDLERSKAESGEEFTINYYSFSFSNIGAGCFEFKYDKNYFELLSVEKGDFLNDTSIFSTINKEYLGYVKISFASNDIKDNDGKNLFKIRLKTIIKEGIKTNIVMSSYELYSSDGMTQYYAKDVNNNIETCETSMPKMFLNAVTDEVNKKLYLTLSLDRDSHLAAADIEIEFEYKVLKYASYDILYKLQNNPMFGVNDKDINKGILKINWVYLEDLTENVDFCKLTFDILDIRQEKTTNINLKVTGARDLNLDEIVILPKGCNVSLSPNYHEWTSWGIIDSANCIKNGKEARTCIFCGIVEERTIEKNDNHNYSDWIIDKEPTCLEKGSRHKMCSLCKNEIIEDIDALGMI